MQKSSSITRDIVTFVLLVVVVVVPIRLFVAQPFVVDGSSMLPTFQNGNYLIVDELTYDFSKPQRGDVIVFRYPGDPSIFYIKRIIGLPNETITIKNGQVTITEPDGASQTLKEPFISAKDMAYNIKRTLGPTQYFVMGDNRPESSDSRVWGPLPANDIIGRVFLRLFPPSGFGVFPGKYYFAPITATTTP
ncbi:MAG: signal peptidase I [Parcubacteria group bacterium 21-54-25]|nr:MAG: signal peptidase I [Parcubacteria group bacterium 21-54-25]HQU08059.1 signal peptidase I [Candidatus Paceibacterota bacterium]